MMLRLSRRFFTFLSIGSVAVIILLPLGDLAMSRIFYHAIPGAGRIADSAFLVLTFAAAALCALDRRHLALATHEDGKLSGFRGTLAPYGDALAVAALSALFWISLSFVLTGFDPSAMIAFVPVRYIVAIIPLAELAMAVFFVRNAWKRAAAEPNTLHLLIALSGVIIGSFLAAPAINNLPQAFGQTSPAWLTGLAAFVQAACSKLTILFVLIFAVGLLAGAPIFTVLAGVAIVFYNSNATFLELIPSEAYSLLQSAPISALPLFGLAGVLLAESGAGMRFVALFREFFGWFRGGEAIAAVLACAFFSTFTGINGITIVALGAILVSALAGSGKLSSSRSRGIITASGDIGLLLPPSAAVIVYGVNAEFMYSDASTINVISLFKGAFIPGLILVISMCIAGVVMSPAKQETRKRFSGKGALAALKPATLELLVPVISIVLYFTGLASLREVGAFAVLYILIVETFVKREFSLRSLYTALGKALPFIGGTLIIIASARGLAYWLIDGGVPEAFSTLVKAHIHSQFVFLILTNIFLIIVGCLMDIYSAILIVSPLLIPLATAFGIDPVHFGVIFLVNLLLGFLTPTAGMNIFLASYTFRESVPRIVRDVLPFIGVQVLILILVTYVPALSTLIK